MARAQQFRGFGNSKTNLNENLEDFRQEALTRCGIILTETSRMVGRSFVGNGRFAGYALIVDASKSRMYVYRNENGKPRYVDDYYVTLGKNGVQKRKEGDKRTPLGVYFSSVKLTEKLPDFYGDAAYPLQYPNEWDNRVGNGGYGIWIHGTPSDSYSRPPRASNGCVVVASPDLKELSPILQDGNTPVIIAEQVQWVAEDQPIPEKEALQLAIEDWRSDWESQNIEQYLEHYSTNFLIGILIIPVG